MSEQPAEAASGGVLKIVAGVFLGLVAGTVIPVMVFMFTMSIIAPMTGNGGGKIGVIAINILNLGLLSAAGYAAYQNMRHSALARGLLIGISITLLLNAICGVAMVTSW